MTIYLDTAAHRQLRMLALETDRSCQALLVEALNDLFQTHGNPGSPIERVRTAPCLTRFTRANRKAGHEREKP